MQEKFIQKRGAIIMELAQYLISKQVGDRLPIISDFQAMFHVSRGTVQNALNYLKDNHFIELESRGHLGTYIYAIDHTALLKLAVNEFFFGTMPLPYSKLYEGFATAIDILFRQKGIRVNMGYVRGSSVRLSMVENESYQFAIVSKFAAEQAINDGKNIEIILDFGKHSYLSKHVLLLWKPENDGIVDGDRVGIDLSSIDQKELTYSLVGNKKVSYLDMPGHQLITAVKQGIIDVGVWNYDEIVDKKLHEVHYKFLENNNLSDALSTAVVVTKKADLFSRKLVEETLDIQQMLDIQQKVKDEIIIPQY